ncbi:hypothetical protein [Streptomyces tropicalis]|uniref:hypothetical protein n=1 Tax=Streptomyces tropicalis TaxID=3034234 RepID=UPI003F689D1D
MPDRTSPARRLPRPWRTRPLPDRAPRRTRRLWDELERIRTWLAVDGDLPIHGAKVTITSDGAATFSRRGWSATLT